ncbi:hypothetical protein ACFX19_004049 [Malus domestica]
MEVENSKANTAQAAAGLSQRLLPGYPNNSSGSSSLERTGEEKMRGLALLRLRKRRNLRNNSVIPSELLTGKLEGCLIEWIMNSLRRRSPDSVPVEPMEKGTGKNQNTRIYFLACLSVFFWMLLLYFHFVVLGGGTVNESVNIQAGPVYSEVKPTLVTNDLQMDSKSTVSTPTPVARYHQKDNQNTESTPTGVTVDLQMDNQNTEATPTYTDDHQMDNKNTEAAPNSVTGDQQMGNQSTGSTPTNVAIAQQTEAPAKTDQINEVEKYPFMRALGTAENKSDPCGGKYIYVHDLPSRFNEDMLKECRSLSLWTNMCKFTTNAGLGPPLENAEGVFGDTSWYATNQFAVDVIFNNRMKQYECLTNDSSIAAAIFVPFYAGFDIARYLWGFNISRRDAASLDLVDWLMKRPEWGIMGGKDHFLVAGRITWDFRRLSEEESDWGNKLLFLPAAKNMSMLVVESSPWNANDFGIPYPTYFHPAKDADVFVWQERMRRLKREFLFSFAGAPRPDNAKSIRGQIIDQCRSSKVGKLLECDFGESKCHSPSSIMQMFQRSLFCLQPQGDSYTRRSAFDSMLAGCIPVFFHPGSAYTQYTWHLPKDYTRYSVFIPEDDIRKRNVSIEETLGRIPPEQAIIDKVTNLRKDIIEGRIDDNFIEENSWKYALLEEGQRGVGAHEWDPFFSKPKDGNGDSVDASAEAAKNSWHNERRHQSSGR